jgi:3-deoxy-manno-octulosonate cytidylyltransferase (CMP-KDO synthetase)
MIIWVVERAQAAANVSRVIVATDDHRIRESVSDFGYEVVMTRADHQSGTDRLAEVALNFPDVDIIVNVQGDEPLIMPATIEQAIDALVDDPNADMATTWEPLESIADVDNPDVVKIVVSDDGNALYFSRAPVPYPRDEVRTHGSLAAAMVSEPGLLRQFKKHTGLYVYRRQVLLDFTSWPRTELESLEGLEQLRALEHGMKIKAIRATAASIGVDTPEDLERVRRIAESVG